MANTNVPIPQRGQPLDLTYIYNLANAVNELSTSLSSSIEKYVTIDTPNVGKISVKASDSKIVAAYQEVSSDATVTADTEKTFSYSFETPYKFAPIATVSPVNVGNTDAGENVRVIINQVTTTGINGVVKFGTAGKATVGVNIIVIGIPN